ncbi:hypothetical protein FEM55_23915 [Dyadobacter sediminis]|uniref:YfhO family protein n=1 Tax=Dyadobacter sediminis TaxID=1493691 RepID=A0A5R9K642_9BACT|nr:hypothetical protein FEM55_23915 [Dyadobacter sediminis]
MNQITWLENRNNRYRLLIAAFALLIFPFVAVSFFNFPTTDDYCHTLAVNNLGYWKYQEHYWKTWSGRYVGTLISSTQPLAYGSYSGYKIAPIVLLFIYVHAFIYFVRGFTLDKFEKWETALFAFLLLFAMITEMPSVAGYFYWYTGYYYTLADIGTLYLLGYLFRNLNDFSWRKIIIICLGMILLIGMNEYTLLWLVCITGAVFFFNSINLKRFLAKEFILSLVALVFGVLSVTAPGNNARAESGLYPTALKYNLIFSAKSSLLWAVHNFSQMAPTLYVLTLVLIPFAARLYNLRRPEEFRFFDMHPAISILVFMASLWLTYFPSYWSIAEPPNLRGQCVINFWTLIGWTYNVFILAFWLSKKGLMTLPTRMGILQWVVGLYFLTSYFSNFNFRSAWSDLITGRASRYNKEMIARTQLVENTKEQQVYVPKLQNVPYTILIVSEKFDPAWASVEVNNGCAEWYFKKKFFYK